MVLLVKAKLKKALSTSIFSMTVIICCLVPLSNRFTVSLVMVFAVYVLVEFFLVAFHVFCYIELQVSLGFSNPIPAILDIATLHSS